MAATSPDSREAKRLFLLVLRCQSGDEGAFAALHAEFSARTRRYVAGLVGDDLADDVHQDVWMTVYRRVRDVDNPAGFRTWLYRVTRHRAIDMLRRERRRMDLVVAPTEALEEVAGAAPDAALGVSEMEPVLARLTPLHREVLLLRFWDDLSYGEMALVAGCSIGTIRSRLHHAKAQVRTIVGAAGSEGE